jgi:GNAT superfamily N-acetyltransferase
LFSLALAFVCGVEDPLCMPGTRTPAAGGDESDVIIVPGAAERIPDLEPLWRSLHQHHAAIAPELRKLGPVRSPHESWAVRSALYSEWLAEPDAFVLLAHARSRPVGYALVHMRAGEETWATGDRIAELETLTVHPDHRGCGVGTAFVRGVHRELRRLGVGHLSVSVIASNADAIRFYERLDLLPFTISYIGAVPRAPSSST